ncbi:MAG: hypothetical protein RQ754_03030 [Desulfuromonadales bacterium]|nr:hypothetical protein [Desulfuromonadales bacterium]
MVEKMKPLSVPPEVHRDLKALAARKGTLLSLEAEKALRQYLRKEQKKLAS